MSVSLCNVSQRFGARWALARLNVELPERKAILLTGENGAGKTTLLRVISTVLRPTRGEVSLFGLSTRQHVDRIRAQIELITHNNFFYDVLSAQQNLELVTKLKPRTDKAEIPALLERVGLARHAERSVGGFSAGMKRRLCFARLLLTKPRLALLDEPFGQLDPGGKAFVDGLIRDLKARGTTLIISTHEIERGRSLCDLHLALSAGRQQQPLQAIA